VAMRQRKVQGSHRTRVICVNRADSAHDGSSSATTEAYGAERATYGGLSRRKDTST
jgi:hypothetical protein